MKKNLLPLLFTVSLSAFASEPQFNDITTKNVEDVSTEFGVNFSHTVVAAPETDGLWGIEVGAVGGVTSSPEFKKVVDNSGGDGSDFKDIYHAGIIARAHGPFEIYGELSFLPEQEVSDAKIKNSSFGLGWNAGRFFDLPLDVAIGMGYAKGDLSFDQDQDIPSGTPAATIDLETTSTIYYVGVSKTFLFVTPYLKAGVASIDGDLDATAAIFDIGGKTSESVSMSGSYFALGANLQFFFIRLGLEATQMHDVSRYSGKLSFAF